ncbi:MAG: type I 3-dehydroquinate dehydratase [Spirochaetales bacterium]|nr:type I 3-dehydroquinate dehydratase [Spirochaetales bacterium]
MLCITLDAPTMRENKAILSRNRAYVSMVELRADMLRKSEIPKAGLFPSQTDLPVILTVRRQRDGGRYTGSEDGRKALLKDLSQAPFSFVDMEVDLNFPSLEYNLMGRGVDIIRSLHDFSGIPRDLPELARVVSSCGQIPKFAVRLSSRADVSEFFHLSELLANIPRKILVGMGPFGLETRLRYRELGSMLTYCSESDPNGIGLPSPEELFRRIEA